MCGYSNYRTSSSCGVVVEDLSHPGVVEDAKINLVIS